MAGILEQLTDESVWKEFLKYKLEKNHLSKREAKELTEFINNKEYKIVTDHLLDDNYTFAPPIKRSINKSGTTKKRVIYSYSKAESMTLKVMVFLLYRYDNKISENCYSFRKNSSAKTAIKRIQSTKGLSNLYCLKLDVSNYFNSIPANKLCYILKTFIDDDPALYSFLERLLLANIAIENGTEIYENRGAMAGIPISPFFANIYLSALDEHYKNADIPYFRYSDDILVFLPTKEHALTEYKYIENFLANYGLSVNPNKISITSPNETWEFLGVSYKDNIIDLSKITKEKLKAKIKRKAHSLYRWRLRKGTSFEQTAKVLIRVFNKKFYDELDEHSFTWSRWFFPVLSTDESLKEIDAYLLQYIRYLYKGRHYKGNYRITYDQIKDLGYKSLVNEYYKYKSGD